MKKAVFLLISLLLSGLCRGQSVRSNYRSEGMTHIATDYESLRLGELPAQARLELVGFPDGSTLYLFYLNLAQKEAMVVPKGTKISFTLPNGKILRAEQIGQSSATPRRLDDGTILSRLKYAIEAADMEKLVKGIRSVDIVTGWNPDDYLQYSWTEDVLGVLLKRHCETILHASDHTIELEASLSGYTENTNSILSTANPIVGRGQNYDYNILLSHLYYKNTNGEDMDLAFVIGAQKQFHIPYDAPVRFILGDDSEIALQQARDDVNFVYVYPSLDDLYKMISLGIKGLSIDYEGGTLEDSFPEHENKDGFSDAVNQQVQLLLSLSPR